MGCKEPDTTEWLTLPLLASSIQLLPTPLPPVPIPKPIPALQHSLCE